MAKKSGNLLIKVAVLIALAAAVFFGLDSWRKQSTGDQAAEQTAPPALSAEEAHRIGTEIGTRIGTEIGTQIGREVAAQMLAERAGETQVAEAAPVEEMPVMPEPEPVAEPVPEPTATTEAPAEEATPVAVDEPATTETAAIDEAAPFTDETAATDPAEAGTKPEKGPGYELGEGDIPDTPVAGDSASDTWWTKTITGEAGDLALTFAGNFTSIGGDVRGIALMFSGRLTRETDLSAISVSGLDSPDWQLGVSPGLIFAPAPAGTYTVTVNTGLTDAEGKSLKTGASGPVNVK